MLTRTPPPLHPLPPPPALVCTQTQVPSSPSTFLVPAPSLGLGLAGSCRQREWLTWTRGQRVRPSRLPIHCYAWRSLALLLFSWEEELVPVKCRGKNKEDPETRPRSAPAGLKNRDSHGRGRGGRPPSFLLRPNDYMSPSDTPTNCYLIAPLTSQSQLS